MQLAEMIGVRPNTVSNYENGNSSPDFEVLGEIVKVLDTDAHSLLFRDLRPERPTAPTRRVSDVAGFYDSGGSDGAGQSDAGTAAKEAAKDAGKEVGKEAGKAADYDRRLAEMALEIEKLKDMVLVLQQKLGI